MYLRDSLIDVIDTKPMPPAIVPRVDGKFPADLAGRAGTFVVEGPGIVAGSYSDDALVGAGGGGAGGGAILDLSKVVSVTVDWASAYTPDYSDFARERMYRTFFEPRPQRVYPSEPRDVRATLLAAADLIEKRGHIKNFLETQDGFCVMGAINYALTGNSRWTGDNGYANQESARLAAYLGLPFDSGLIEGQTSAQHQCVLWNNAPERTAGEVISALRGAAYAA